MSKAMIPPKFYAWDRNGKPLAFGKVYTYQSRTNAEKPTYKSEDSKVENTNPVILSGEGYADIYLSGSYKIVVKDSNDNEIWSADPVTEAESDVLSYMVTAYYISSTSFKALGNHTGAIIKGGRVKFGFVGSSDKETTVISSVYDGEFTVVLVEDALIRTDVTAASISTGFGAISNFQVESKEQLEKQEDEFQSRFSLTQPAIEWQSALIVEDNLQLYSTGLVGESGYSVWLPDPNKTPFTASSTFSEDQALDRWKLAIVSTNDWTEEKIEESRKKSELEAAALAAGTTYDNITYSTNLVDEIKGYIFDATKQVIYAVPEAAQGKFIQSVVDGVLTTTDTSEYKLTSAINKKSLTTILPSSARNGEVVESLGFYSEGDGGHGVFVYNDSIDRTLHDGIHIIAPDVVFENIESWWESTGIGFGCYERQIGDGVITASQCGLLNESLYDSTQLYKLVSYDVKRWTQSIDSKFVFDWFYDSPYSEFIIDNKVVYSSLPTSKISVDKVVRGINKSKSGIIQGGMTFLDGSKNSTYSNISLYGKIGKFDVPLPITGDVSLKDDVNYFYVGDISTFGWGFGVFTVATTSDTGNTDSITVEDCVFEMRGGTISGGSAPDDEDRPKATNVIFRRNINRNCFYHGASSIHLKDMLVYENIMFNQYYGYAVDFSTGSVNCKAYENISLGYCNGGAKAESNKFPTGNHGCEIYDNHFTVVGGNGFNMVFRSTGKDTDFYRNTVHIYEYDRGGQVTPVAGVYAPNNTIKSNTFNIHSVNDTRPLTTIVVVREDANATHSDISLIFDGNTINNYTSEPLWTLSFGAGDIDKIEIIENKQNGKFSGVVNNLYGVNSSVNELTVSGTRGTVGALLHNAQTASIGRLNVSDNKGEIGENIRLNRVLSVSFLTILDKITLRGNELNGAGLSRLDLLAGTANVDFSNAELTIDSNDITGLTGAAVYLYNKGIEVDIKTAIIKSNALKWGDTSTEWKGFRLLGAETMLMNANSLTNTSASTVTIIRPADSDTVKYEYNSTAGLFTDQPAS